MKLILLTGATGFVGREILSDLIKKKYRIRVVLREESSQTIDDNSNIDSIITTTDMFAESEDWWEETFEDVDTIIHAAWYVKSGNLYSQ